MKKLLLLISFVCSAFLLRAQDGANEYKGRRNLTATHDRIIQANTISELSPEMWHRMQLNYSERDRLDKMLHMQHSLYFSLVSAKENDVVFPNSAYEKLVDYISFELIVSSKGKNQSLSATGKELTVAQKALLKSADLGSHIFIKVKYYYLKEGRQKGKIHEGVTTLEPLPFHVAEYAGGYKAITQYLQSKVLDKITTPDSHWDPFYASVRFTIDETGKVVQVKIIDASRYPEIDALLIKALQQMPGWRAARNSQNIAVRETFTITYPFVDGC